MKKDKKKVNNVKIIISIIVYTAMAFMIFGLIILFRNSKIETYQRIIIDKTIEINEGLLGGHTRYMIAYDDGCYQVVDYGKYSSTNIGDTIYFKNRIVKTNKNNK
jgi:hypothetical protein